MAALLTALAILAGFAALAALVVVGVWAFILWHAFQHLRHAL